MSATYETDDFGTDMTNEIVAFARAETLDIRYYQGGALPNAERLAGVENMETLVFEEGMFVNKANTVSLVYDAPEVPKAFQFGHNKLSAEAETAERDVWESDKGTEFHYVLFTFPNGNVTSIQEKYLDTISEVFGVDPIENPEVVVSDPDYDGYPIRVDSPVTPSYILVAPLAKDW